MSTGTFALEVAPRTSLRRLEEEDAAELFRLIEANRAVLREWLPWLDRVTQVGHVHAFIRSTHDQLSRGTGLRACLLHDGRIAGVVGYYALDREHRAGTLAYWLGGEFQGKGLMTRSVAALLDHGFGPLGLHRAEIRAAAGNVRSRAIPERLGFVQEGLLRQREWLYDHFVDHVVYGLLAAEWPRRDRPPAGT